MSVGDNALQWQEITARPHSGHSSQMQAGEWYSPSCAPQPGQTGERMTIFRSRWNGMRSCTVMLRVKVSRELHRRVDSLPAFPLMTQYSNV